MKLLWGLIEPENKDIKFAGNFIKNIFKRNKLTKTNAFILFVDDNEYPLKALLYLPRSQSPQRRPIEAS